MKAIYRFDYDCGRHGALTGIFVAEHSEILEAVGKKVYFGEVLGKHSEVQDIFDEADLQVITTDKEAVSIFELYEMETGYNPLYYLEEEQFDMEDEFN